ncbi:MAG: methyltransferase domain-containing protein, partial [Steroidobacteraceae bacterium]
MRRPIDVPTRATAAFIAGQLPSRARILEVGCGDGQVVMELQASGFQVVGVDSDAEIIARAQERGAPVIQASWPAFETDTVAAIAFTRSLHHIHPLPEAVSRAHELLQ